MAMAKKATVSKNGKYTEAKDRTVDAKFMKKMSPAQKIQFMKADKKHPKAKTMAQDANYDRKIMQAIVKKTKPRTGPTTPPKAGVKPPMRTRGK
jgi:hypothetical protein